MVENLIENNRRWSREKTRVDPDFFSRLVRQQHPEYLWIGCSDSRVPANEIVDLDPGELFVHRNVANLAPQQDANYLSVLQYAVNVLKIKHVLVVGHYGCGGVRAAIESTDHGLIDHWLSPIRDVAHEHRHELEACDNQESRVDRLCELNVIAQVRNVATNPIILHAWREGQPLSIHGWVYSIANGLVTDMNISVRNLAERERLFGI
ncbi:MULTISPECIES: carbonic anhydrase [Asticcacaulis]|uniref:Carbonic anhydrase n=1 Tax=Asticcacaulis excentricus TaxID=78587 RepID=A0A3G9G684_9CAUL|nr:MULTISPECIES: carbonic anhydrase [Asticcacaulis]MCA1935592.1 carbonic anhydrase [Asticcacaulis sp.]BBF81341.1 carbonic anhydrase [Asticcacaulis excentricus]